MESPANQRPVSVGDDVFARDGDMGALMRTVDWASTPLGPVEQWPQTLRTAVSICLHSRFPILIWWGPELVMLYNDAYREILGAKHPQSMGQRGRECWPEIWDVIGPMLHGVLREGVATWSNDQLLLLNRNGFAEECYFTFSYSPIYGESGGVDGVFCAVTETSDRVVGERRLRTLRELATDAGDARTPVEACRLAAQALATNPADLPFTLLYSLESVASPLAGTTNVNASPILSGYTGFADRAGAEALGARMTFKTACARVMQTGEVALIGAFGGAPAALTLAGERVECVVRQALLLPIKPSGMEQASGVLIAGISPLRALDDAYRSFLNLVAGQLATAIANATAYEQDRRRAEALAELDRAKTAFFSNVSHEFRTPLTLLLGPLADLLTSETAVSPDVYAQLEIVQRNGLRLLRLVNSLLDFSRIEAGRTQALFEPTDLPAYTAELASAFRSLVEKAGLRLVVDCPPLDDLPEPVYVDRAMWEKIVLNLLSNAFKFTFTGEIVVTLRQVGNAVELVVCDTGVGVPAAEVGRLFERFHRVEGVRSRTHEGSGIGLALTQELVHLHGGNIHVESVEGEGASFFVRLPLGATHLPAEHVQASAVSDAVSAAMPAAAASYVEEAARWLPDASIAVTPAASHPALDDGALPLASAPTHPARILLADDNADMRDYLRRMLSERYTVETVANGAEALDTIARQPPDLVVSDVMMPELDGFGLLRALRANPYTAAIPIILLSARAGEEAIVEGLQAGADDYLIKPFSARELMSRVAARLEIMWERQQAIARAQQLDTVFATMADGVVIYDENGGLVTWNAALAELFEFERMPAYAGMPVAERPARLQVRDEHNHPLTGEQLPFMRAMRGEHLTGSHAADLIITTPSGKEKQVNVSTAPLHDDAGQVIGAVAIYRDVTERRALESRTHDVLEALLEMATAITAFPDEDSGYPDGGLSAQPTIQQLVELAQRVLVGAYTSIVVVNAATGAIQPLAVVGLSPEDEADWWAKVSQARLETYITAEDAARLSAGEEVIISSPSEQPPVPGQYYWGIKTSLVVPALMEGQMFVLSVEVRNRPAFTDQERDLARATARLAALVVEREQLTRQREEARTQAQIMTEATRRMDEFLGVASHELRTPLTTVTANAQMATRQLNELLAAAGTPSSKSNAKIERVALMLDRINRQTHRLDRLVGDLLDVSRIQAGKLELRMEPCDLLAIVRDCVQEQQSAWPERAITLELPRRATTLPLHADADRIGQVITNFLTNALKYSSEDQPVAVRITVRSGTVRVAVQDAGPGLSPEQQAHLWERFYRVPGIELQSGSGVGLGLGLHICKTLIERHGGQVGVESAPGAGSAFWCTLPLAGANEEHPK